MFGRNRQHAQAVIIARETHDGTYRKGVNFYAPTGQYHHVYDYVADVTPADGETPFRGMFTEMFESDEEYRPLPGDTVTVTFDKDHKVAFDRRALYERAQASKNADRGSFAALASQPVGTPAPGAPAPSAPAPGFPAPGAAGPRSDPAADPRIGILQVSLRQAQIRSDTDEVNRLTAKLVELEGEGDPSPGA